jgi:hypothetical protein
VSDGAVSERADRRFDGGDHTGPVGVGLARGLKADRAVPAALSMWNRLTSTTKVYGEPSGRRVNTVSPVSICSIGT